MFSAQVNTNSEFTSIPGLALVERDSRHKCSLQKELRRYELRSIFPQKPPFRPHFGAFYPHPAHKSALRVEGATHSLATKKPGWSPTSTWTMFSLPTPHALRRPEQRGQVVSRPSPAGYCHLPTAGLAKTKRSPISTIGPSMSVCHRTGRLIRTNQTFSPRSSPPDR